MLQLQTEKIFIILLLVVQNSSHFPSFTNMMQLVVFLLLTFGLAGVSCDSSSPATFYIKPTNATNPDCPSDCPCVTLDHLAVNELSNLKNTDSVTLILLEGVHTSTVTLNFVQIQHVVMISQNRAHLEWADMETPQTLIQLLSSNISVVDVSNLDIKNLAIDGGGTSVLLMQKNSGSWSISFHLVSMLGIIFQIQPLSADATSVVTITSSLFKVSRIEIKLCVYAEFEQNGMQNAMIQQSMVYIKSTRFLTRREIQLSSVVVFSPKFMESQWLLFDLDNVTTSALADSALLPSFPPLYFCDGVTKLQRSSDIYIFSDYVRMTITNCYFFGNKSTAIYAENSLIKITNCTFTGYSQGALIFDGSIELKLLIDNTIVFNNTIRAGELVTAAAGLLISSYGQTDLVNCRFYGNTDLGGNSQIIELIEAGKVNIHSSTFANNNGRVINCKQTDLSFSGVVTFTGNSAHQGGALSLTSISLKLITLVEYTTVNFIHNSASQFGGAIYIDFFPSLILVESGNNNLCCFYGPPNVTSSFKHITLNFWNNSAGKGGDHIYGISVKNYCKIYSESLIEDPWKHVFHIEPNTTLSSVTSDVLRACICDKHGQPQCANLSKIFTTSHAVYPGESFTISAVTVGAEFGTTVGEVYARLLPRSSSTTSYNASLGDSQQHVQRITENDHCTVLHYSLHTRNSYEILYLTVTDWTLYIYGDVNEIESAIEKYRKTEVIPRSLLITPIFINVTIRFPCPIGFTLVGQPPRCDCYPELRRKNIDCKIKNGMGYVSRRGRCWIGMKGEGVIFNDHCPLSHCKSERELLKLENDSDSQCSHDHSGVLCGGCREGYSVAIGSSSCLYCPSNTNSALFLFFVLAGPLLYVLIAALNLTITEGTINGLLFYANIVWIYQTALFSVTTNEALDIFKVLVAWLNLDFGIEMCFIKGLDAFWKSLLQYIFPIYIWLIVYMVVLMYRHTNIHQRFPRISNILGKPTHVLVTFLLMSYTKFARTIIDALQFSTLTNYPSNSKEIVWALDGNVRYFRGKHIVLFILALFATTVSLFFAMLVLIMGFKNNMLAYKHKFTQILKPDRKVVNQIQGELNAEDNYEEGFKATCLAQVHRCKSFIFDIPLPLHDALFALHNNKHKYWLGLMLFVRVALLILFTATSDVNQNLNLFVLLLVATVLLLYLAWNNVYNDRYVQMIEGLALGNMVFCSGGMIYANLQNNEAWKSAIACISAGIAFVQFLGIIVHCTFKQCFKNFKQQIPTQIVAIAPTSDIEEVDSSQNPDQLLNINDWRETGMANGNGVDSECEPLLAHAAPFKHNDI